MQKEKTIPGFQIWCEEEEVFSEAMEATIAEGDVCQVIAHQLLKDLGESHRIKEATEDNSPCPHHEEFVGKVSLRVQNKSLSFSEREEFCVVEGDSRMLVLNMPMPEQDKTPAILPIGLFASTTPRKGQSYLRIDILLPVVWLMTIECNRKEPHERCQATEEERRSTEVQGKSCGSKGSLA
ncbi:hypothetical protein HRR83_007660 [Exophiala dermatitidis]|nr:hypothetical protein HRR74_007103 [Exophiala dermatitidis]KAJ4521798.1 hypothetical protein HRR73_002996 [Exophiala dermatitidis]KAJ4539493.1 hypothetical protein HRR77_006376 [Exophiala dermatitidis]KAJ4548428.1 hypothetical protein HRR76_001028 [Exophiala dermatitidis]KAJ4562915.1 hypothetical protein HRR79_006510 [Exophiala dermatitidis]